MNCQFHGLDDVCTACSSAEEENFAEPAARRGSAETVAYSYTIERDSSACLTFYLTTPGHSQWEEKLHAAHVHEDPIVRRFMLLELE